MNKFTIKWQAYDGYIGKDRPNETRLSANDISSEDNFDEVMMYIADAVQEDFNQKVYPMYDESSAKEIAAKLMALAAERDKE